MSSDDTAALPLVHLSRERTMIEEDRGTFCCPLCGVDEPHPHDPSVVDTERFFRPAFERFIIHKIKCGNHCMNDAVKGHWKGSTPTNTDSGYAFVFGWGKYSGSAHPYIVQHWAYRRHLGAEYQHQSVEALWLCWLAATLSIKSGAT